MAIKQLLTTRFNISAKQVIYNEYKNTAYNKKYKYKKKQMKVVLFLPGFLVLFCFTLVVLDHFFHLYFQPQNQP